MIPRSPRTRGHHTVEQLRSEGGTGPLPWGEAPTTGDRQQVRQLLTEPERGARPVVELFLATFTWELQL